MMQTRSLRRHCDVADGVFVFWAGSGTRGSVTPSAPSCASPLGGHILLSRVDLLECVLLPDS